jgi:hypothetical protein
MTPCTFSLFPIAVWTSIAILGLAVVSIIIKLLLEWQAELQIHPSGAGHQNNTHARNKALTTIYQFALFAVMWALTQALFIVPRFLQVEFTMNVFIAGECCFQVMTAFVMPLVLYMSCEDMRHYFKSEFWENAPECLQIYNLDSQPEPAQARPSQPVPARASLSQPEPAQASPSQLEPAKISLNQPEPAQDSPHQTKPDQTSPIQHKPARAITSQPKPSQASPSQCG